MDELFSEAGKAGRAALQDIPPTIRFPGRPGALPGPHHPDDFVRKLFSAEALTPVEKTAGKADTEPFSLQWFLDIENRRYGKHGKWIPRLLEFAKHGGETLLGLGDGLGTDWIQYARHGAAVVVCGTDSGQLQIMRRNFELRRLPGRFVHARLTHLPLETSSVDVACLNHLGKGMEDFPAVVEEVFRVLKPGGKVLAVVHARYDVDFWVRTAFCWYRWLWPGYRRHTGEPRYAARELRQLFSRFVEQRIHKRQLRRAEVPYVWRGVPLPLLARLMGRVLVLKGFKTLSMVHAVQLAAA